MIVLSPPVILCPGKHDTSTTVPTITGKVVVVVVKFEREGGSPLHVSVKMLLDF